jgi:hypothetical protein
MRRTSLPELPGSRVHLLRGLYRRVSHGRASFGRQAGARAGRHQSDPLPRLEAGGLHGLPGPVPGTRYRAQPPRQAQDQQSSMQRMRLLRLGLPSAGDRRQDRLRRLTGLSRRSYALVRRLRLSPQPRSALAPLYRRPSALIGASNFFELAVVTAIALFGFESLPTRYQGDQVNTQV